MANLHEKTGISSKTLELALQVLDSPMAVKILQKDLSRLPREKIIGQGGEELEEVRLDFLALLSDKDYWRSVLMRAKRVERISGTKRTRIL